MQTYRFRQGAGPLLVSMPHVGTHLPEALRTRLTPAALALPDTDWHLERLYDFLDAIGASVLVATHSRYVVDLNRPPDDANLYPGQDTTGLIPVDTFHREALYLPGAAPDAAEGRERVERFWRPYHDKLAFEIARLKAAHGVAMLWDAHSIFSVLPRFFPGRLPDLNLGTADGRACAPQVAAALETAAGAATGYQWVLNGRFKGGYITRTYGRPDAGIHAVQLELAEVAYMDEAAPYGFREDLAIRLRPHLKALIEAFVRAVPRPSKG